MNRPVCQRQFGFRFLEQVQILMMLGFQAAKRQGVPVCELRYR